MLFYEKCLFLISHVSNVNAASKWAVVFWTSCKIKNCLVWYSIYDYIIQDHGNQDEFKIESCWNLRNNQGYKGKKLFSNTVFIMCVQF